ncbi:MAG: alpha/beta hydrolase [Solobacterium sp.]|nr:alpha/beta hydrolase [Solobacterium sp.]
MRRKLIWLVPALFGAVLSLVFLAYTGMYYHADTQALAALETDENVTVTKTDYGWYFDGPAEENVLVFYPGAKVEETAYAPLLHRLADNGMDACLVKMPFRLAVLGAGKAAKIPETADYANVYIGGHSLGGAMAANYAADHADELSGVILLAAYPTKELDDDLQLISIYGSEDGVLNMEKVKDGGQYAPEQTVEQIIAGGNHAYFGDYGEQKGDSEARITAQEQQEETAEIILENVDRN